MQGTKKDRSGDPARKFRPQGAIAAGLHSITEGEKSPTSKKSCIQFSTSGWLYTSGAIANTNLAVGGW